ncbi:ankyrin repeat-containing domain protein [Mycena latifolia]|nr:ankyrin repeat-containing domain protein [Mycena latifolia]
MAETLGIVTSAVQLVDTALKAREYVKDFINAPQEQRKLFSDMDALRPLMVELQKRVSANPSCNILQQMTGPLEKFKTTMERLVERIRPALAARSSWSKLSNQLTWTLWNKKEVVGYLDEFESIKSLLNTWLVLDIWDVSRQQQQDTDGILSSIRDATHNQHATERDNIIDWITSENFLQRQADIYSAWQPGTGEWLLEHPRFKNWESSSGTILWCNGMPGAGKTVLASMVVNHLGARFWNDNIGVACMYLNHKETETQTPANLLAAIWTQLVIGKPIPAAVHELYQHHRERRTRPSADEVHAVLRNFATTQYSRVYLIVDALDEYPDDQRDFLLEKLSAMGPSVNLMITSRPHITLVDFFPDVKPLEIRATEDDIRRYVDIQIHRSHRLAKHVNVRPELRDEIRSRVIGSVDGMFLLAKLHMASLTTKNTVKAVREALRQLPTDLKRTYDEAMERVDGQGEEDRQIAQLTLTWVANAKRPLLVAELQEALAIEPETTALDADNILDIDIILSVCAGLVVVDETIHVVRLIHYTMQHYLDSIQTERFPHAHTEITSRCLTYLSFPEFEKPPSPMSDTILSEHPFLAYCHYCFLHAAGEPEEHLADEIIKGLKAVELWRRYLWDYMNTNFLDFNSPPPPWNYPNWPSSASPLWISAASNLRHVARRVLAEGEGSGEVKNPAVLQVASYYGHLEMVQLLMEHGADVNARDGGTALQAAAYMGQEPVVKLLIEKNADVNAQGGQQYGTAMQAAASAGHERMVGLLLEHGADVNIQGGRYGTALQAAAFRGYEAVARLLVMHGADINAQGGRYGTALRAASYQGHEGIIRLLIQHGADVNFHGALGTALEAALYWGHQAAMHILIDNGTDVNAQRGEYGPVLQTVSYEGNLAAVQILLENGADVNLKGGKYGTALQAASVRGHQDVVALLIDHGADVNAEGGKHGTAMSAASREGHQAVIKLLSDAGAYMIVQDAALFRVNAPGSRLQAKAR